MGEGCCKDREVVSKNHLSVGGVSELLILFGLEHLEGVDRSEPLFHSFLGLLDISLLLRDGGKLVQDKVKSLGRGGGTRTGHVADALPEEVELILIDDIVSLIGNAIEDDIFID